MFSKFCRTNEPIMKKILFLIFIVVGGDEIYAQSCDSYVQFKEGASWTMTSYSAKDKVTNTVNSKTTTVTKTGTKTEAAISQSTKNEKGKEEMSGSTTVSCDGNKFSMDMRSLLLNDDQAKAYKDMELKFEGTVLSYPESMKAGDTLSPVSMSMTATQSGMQVANIKMKMTNRKVEAKESITTSAGTFECYKITYDFEMVIGTMFNMTIKGNTKEWFSYGIGEVRSESYKNEKLKGYTVLTALTK